MWSVAIIWISQLYMFRNVFFFPLLKISRDKISFSKPVSTLFSVGQYYIKIKDNNLEKQTTT